MTRHGKTGPNGPRHQHWLIDTLWGREAVGIIGGEPKCGKSFLALDLAVSVAAGVPCLRHFPATHTGPVLMYAAEDAGHIVRTRLEGIAKAAGTAFNGLDIAVIDVPVLRLDLHSDRQRLLDTVERIRPRLLVLDPLVRLHRVDENAVAEIAPILAFLRELQRRFYTAVVLVHHARKNAATRPGQALRGSSELHVEVDRHYYSVPHALVGRQLDVRVTATTVECLYRGQRVASHVRSPLRGRHTTADEHMPEKHRKMGQWSPERFIRWATTIGPHTAALIETVLRSRRHPQQAFRSCLGILRLADSYGEDRLEAASRRAVALGANSYRSVESILTHRLDQRPSEQIELGFAIEHANIRGASYYN